MFSAFSFGKIIKTLLPGSILSGGLVLLCEAIALLATDESLLTRLADQQLLGVAGGILVPVSLVLGFLLNTFCWLWLNKRIRSGVDDALKDTTFPAMRAALTGRMWSDISCRIAVSGDKPTPEGQHSRETLEYFYLPVVKLEHLSYLWESYFSWFEFQVNTGLAAALSFPSLMLLAGVLMWPEHPAWFVVLFVSALLLLLRFCRNMWIAGRKNLVEYEKNLMLLITGSLKAAEQDEGAGNRPP